MSSQSRAAARVGTTLANKYALKRLLGTGGMGAVYEAENLRTQRRVAVKLLLSDDLDPRMIKRFLREARAGSRLEHPNIVQVFDMDQDATDGTPYIVQEFLQGRDLREELDERGCIPPRDAVQTILPVMRGIAQAHAAGIVHRDLKPENIFLAKTAAGDTLAKVIDFGIAKLHDRSEEPTSAGGTPRAHSTVQRTETGQVMGTPRYMSPEQALGEGSVDARTDIWAMGVVLFELIAGHTPCEETDYLTLVTTILTTAAPTLESEGFDRELSLVIARALERDLSKRWRAIESMADALEEWLEHAPAKSVDLPAPRRASARDDHATAKTVDASARAKPETIGASTPPARELSERIDPDRSAGLRWRWAIGIAVGLLAGVMALSWKALVGAPQSASRSHVTVTPAETNRVVPPSAVAPAAAPVPIAAAQPEANPQPTQTPPPSTAPAATTPHATAPTPIRATTPNSRPRTRRPAVINDAPVIPL